MAVRKSVLVQCGNFNRVVTFKCDESRVAVGATERDLLCEAIRVSYSERIGPNDRLTLQAKSEEWDGMLVDFFEDDVQDKMTLMLVVEKPEVRRMTSCCIYIYIYNSVFPHAYVGDQCAFE